MVFACCQGQVLHAGPRQRSKLDFVLETVAQVEQPHSQAIASSLPDAIEDPSVAKGMEYPDERLPRNPCFLEDLRERQISLGGCHEFDDIHGPIHCRSVSGSFFVKNHIWYPLSHIWYYRKRVVPVKAHV